MPERPKLEIQKGGSATVTLLYDKPKTGVNSQGNPWQFYGVTHEGVEKGYFASEKAHEMLRHYNKGDTVRIEHKITGENRSMYVVSPTTQNAPKSDMDQNIKWGMAFNNTTRLVCAFPLHRDEGIGDRVGLIEELLPKMYKIACSMPEEYKERSDDELFI